MAEPRILLVEDERPILELLSMVLLAEGYAIDAADTAALANRYLDTVRYELVATDYRLPDGDGMTIADRAAALGSKTIIFSGYLFMIPADTATRHELLMKPMRPSELVEAVRRRLDG